MEIKKESKVNFFADIKYGKFIFENLSFTKMCESDLSFFKEIVCDPKVVGYSNVTPGKKTAVLTPKEAEIRFFERALPSSYNSFPLCRYIIVDKEKVKETDGKDSDSAKIGLFSFFKQHPDSVSWALYFTPENQSLLYFNKAFSFALELVDYLRSNALYEFENVQTIFVDYRKDNLCLRSSAILNGFEPVKKEKEDIECNGVNFTLTRITYQLKLPKLTDKKLPKLTDKELQESNDKE